MSIPVFYWFLSSQSWSVYSLVSAFSVFCPREENSRVKHRHRSYKPVLASLTDWWVHTSHQTNVYLDKRCCGSSMKKQGEVFLSLVLSWELSFVTSENILPDLCHPKGTYTVFHLVASWIDWDSVIWNHKNILFVWPCQLSGEFVMRIPTPYGMFGVLTFIALLVLEKSHSCNAYLLSSIYSSLWLGAFHVPMRREQHHFYYIILIACDNKDLSFHRLTLEVNFWVGTPPVFMVRIYSKPGNLPPGISMKSLIRFFY